MPAADDTKYMMRCLELASKAEGMTYPNPLVGSVIVHDGKIIGEGYHLKAGRPHAEVAAVESVNDRNLLKSATLYVNLEPCSHFGKTPPCADFIIANSFYGNITIDNFQYNNIETGVGVNFSTATYVYQAYNKTIFTNSANAYKLSYYDANDNLNVVNITD